MSTEADVIRCWLRGLFKTIENVDDVEVKDFNFGPLEQFGEKRKSYRNKSLAVLKQVTVSINVMNVEKDYSLIVKVLPTDDNERYSIKHKFKQLLRFSKEVQVYMEIVNPMFSLCNEMVSQLKFSCPPVAEVFLGQMDALNDCLVLENLSKCGFVKYKQKINESVNPNGEKSDEKCDNDKAMSELISHCNIVLQNMAKFHALSLVISRLEGQALSEIFPFAVEGEGFRQDFKQKIMPLRERLLDYSRWSQSALEDSDRKHLETLIDNKIHDLFWVLLEKRSRPKNVGKEVLVHGNLDFTTIMFKYENNKPADCKFLDLSHVNVSSPMMDIITFLYRVMSSSSIETCHLTLLLTYHHHLVEFCHQLGVMEGIVSLEELLKEFDGKKMFGMIMSCKVVMAERLLKLDDNEEGINSLQICSTKVSLLLESIADTCDCPTHTCNKLKEKTLADTIKLEKTETPKKKEGAFVTFIKSSSLSPRLRNIL